VRSPLSASVWELASALNVTRQSTCPWVMFTCRARPPDEPTCNLGSHEKSGRWRFRMCAACALSPDCPPDPGPFAGSEAKKLTVDSEIPNCCARRAGSMTPIKTGLFQIGSHEDRARRPCRSLAALQGLSGIGIPSRKSQVRHTGQLCSIRGKSGVVRI